MTRLYLGTTQIGGLQPAKVSSATMGVTPLSFTAVNISGTNYRYYDFTASGSITFSDYGYVDFLLIGPGGAYGGNAGGGGGGGFIELNNFVVRDQAYPIVIGAGYGGPTTDSYLSGSSSSFAGIYAICGGSGSAYFDRSPGIGASGGGGGNADGRTVFAASTSHDGVEGQGTIGTKMKGGRGGNAGSGGGGGAGGNGSSGGGGGAGAASLITGTSTTFCRGGGSSTPQTANTGNGGWTGSGQSGRFILRIRV